jgi:hypothetical protein
VSDNPNGPSQFVWVLILVPMVLEWMVEMEFQTKESPN